MRKLKVSFWQKTLNISKYFKNYWIPLIYPIGSIEHYSINVESQKLLWLEKGGSDPYVYRTVHWILGDEGPIISNVLLYFMYVGASLCAFYVLFVLLFLSFVLVSCLAVLSIGLLYLCLLVLQLHIMISCYYLCAHLQTFCLQFSSVYRL